MERMMEFKYILFRLFLFEKSAPESASLDHFLAVPDKSSGAHTRHSTGFTTVYSSIPHM